ncbi:putative ORFan [Tupanvirus deep ocean]|uniref:ORFan n=2 Tax=Tupanvirus TaxID=2094720 RepID=A0AC62A7L7_9VIRU|nr:putative ORFan [Tupanvirus deep ocean]QKU33673.1 putative ORFan [Tupanvirus deep ocean]
MSVFFNFYLINHFIKQLIKVHSVGIEPTSPISEGVLPLNYKRRGNSPDGLAV